jgi:hypothetical protein
MGIGYRKVKGFVFWPNIFRIKKANLKQMLKFKDPLERLFWWEYHIVCQKDDIFEYVTNWKAKAIQKPLSHKSTALCYRGIEGIAKGTTLHNIYGKKLFGSKKLCFLSYISGNYQYLTAGQLNTTFNQWLYEKTFLFLDECCFAGNKMEADFLKSAITNDM